MLQAQQSPGDICQAGEDLFALPFVRAADIWFLGDKPECHTHLRRIYDHELVFVISGRGRITLGEASSEVGPETLFLVQPQVWHSYFPVAGETLALLGVHFDWENTSEFAPFSEYLGIHADSVPDDHLWRMPRSITHWDIAQKPFFSLIGRTRVRQLLEQVVATHALYNEYSERQAAAILSAAIFQIAYEAQLQNRFLENPELSPDALRRMYQARELLETPLLPNAYRTIEEVAREVGWSSDHLRRIFRLRLGASPQDVQMAARIRRAKQLLKTRFSVHETAYQCGFSDPAYFSRVFKKLSANQSPRQYAAKYRAMK